MVQLVDIFGYLSTLLRAATLALQSTTIGGIVFAVLVAGPLRAELGPAGDAVLASIRRMVAASALALAVAAVLVVAVNAAVLSETLEMALADVVGARFFLAGISTAVAGLCIAAFSDLVRRRGASWLLLLAGIVLAGSVVTSHAASRVEDRILLGVGTALHQGAVAVWLGGLPYLLMTLARCREERAARLASRRFSRMALASVSALGAAGLALSRAYIDSPEAIYGTAYGLMLATKVVLFAVLLVLGAMNFFLVRRTSQDPAVSMMRLRRFVEVEIGIGFTVILAAASLTSQPPAADLTADRVTAAEIVDRMTPRWPRLTSSSLESLSPSTLQMERQAAAAAARSDTPLSFIPGTEWTHPNTPADMAWSEYNHHWAGMVVLAIGLLALAERTGRARWARHWPLLFLGLAVFLFLRSDPENWPYGPNGFFESFAYPEVAQHRVFVVLIVALGLFEWAVRTHRIASARAALAFPLLCAIGGAVLLTHSHSVGNVKEELLIEMTHIPIAVLGVIAGWARWLEVRLPESDRRIPSWIWPACFVLIGIVLLLYRES